MVALVASRGLIRLVQVDINWNLSPDFKLNNNMRPILTAKNLCSTTWDSTAPATAPGPSYSQSSELRPTHVELLPAVGDGKDKHPPELFIVLSRPSAPNSFQPPVTVIHRWQALTQQKQDLCASLDTLAAGKNPDDADATRQQSTRLQPSEPCSISKALINMHSTSHHRVLVLSYADGSAEYRDRRTMEELYAQPTPERLSALQQAGFKFEKQIECALPSSVSMPAQPLKCSAGTRTNEGGWNWNKQACKWLFRPPNAPWCNWPTAVVWNGTSSRIRANWDRREKMVRPSLLMCASVCL